LRPFSFASEEITMLQCYVLTCGRSVTAFSTPPRSQRPGQGSRMPHPKAGPASRPYFFSVSLTYPSACFLGNHSLLLGFVVQPNLGKKRLTPLTITEEVGKTRGIYYLWFWLQWYRRVLSSGMWRHVFCLIGTYNPVKHAASVLKVGTYPRNYTVSHPLTQRFPNFSQVGTTFISQNVLRTTLLLSPLKAN
jgi:hypothetical protein